MVIVKEMTICDPLDQRAVEQPPLSLRLEVRRVERPVMLAASRRNLQRDMLAAHQSDGDNSMGSLKEEFQ
jgi:hypothetical protein